MRTQAKALLANVINNLGAVPGVGQLLRRVANLYRDGSIVTIRSGLAGGLKWKRYHRFVNGYWVGNYELPIQHALDGLLRQGDVFYDIGANAGFFSILASRLVGDDGIVYAFEPLPENISVLREQVWLNGLNNCEPIAAAAGDQNGTSRLRYSPENASIASLDRTSDDLSVEVEVEVTTLDVFAKKHRAPDVLKIDVEGFGGPVLEAARAVLNGGPTLLLEVHTPEEAAGFREALDALEYRYERLDGSRCELVSSECHIIARPAQRRDR